METPKRCPESNTLTYMLVANRPSVVSTTVSRHKRRSITLQKSVEPYMKLSGPMAIFTSALQRMGTCYSRTRQTPKHIISGELPQVVVMNNTF